MKKVIKSITFLILIVLIFVGTFKVLWLHTISYYVLDEFYSLPEDSLDAVFVGSSGAREFYISCEGFGHSGLSMYSFAVGGMPCSAIKYFIKEASKTQNPEVYLIDIRPFVIETVDDGSLRNVCDSMRMSKNRFDVIDEMANNVFYCYGGNINKYDYYFSYSTYHSRWQDVTKKDFFGDDSLYLGYGILDYKSDLSNLNYSDFDVNKSKIKSYNEEYLLDLIEYVKQLDAKVAFVDSPSFYTSEERAQINYVKDILRNNGCDVIEFSDITVFDFDFANDFRDEKHVNTFGAIKFSDYLSDYIMTRYNLKDHRSEDKYSKWIQAYEGLRSELNNNQ